MMGEILTDTAAAAPATPNCRECRHFAISWKPHTPYLCSLMGFCSRNLPSVEVMKADGQPCRGHSPKVAPGSGLMKVGDERAGVKKTHSQVDSLHRPNIDIIY